MEKGRGGRLAVLYRRESREGQLVEGDCVGSRNRWVGGGVENEEKEGGRSLRVCSSVVLAQCKRVLCVCSFDGSG